MIPSTNKLAEFLGVNQTTINRSIQELTNNNILYKKRGIGMFVTKEALDIIQKHRNDFFKENTLKEFIKDAKNLGISKNELIEMLKEEM